MLEVEQKFRVDDLDAMERRIVENLEIESVFELEQQDWYFSHPDRDFRATDEALRIRRTQVAGNDSASSTLITYKGPRLNSGTAGRDFKTRREIELPIGGDRHLIVRNSL